MSEADGFHALLLRVCAGDQEAEFEIVKQYDLQLRIIVRNRLRSRRHFKLSVSNIVAASWKAFFQQARRPNGRERWADAGRLIAWLRTVASRKIGEVERLAESRANRDPQGADALPNLKGHEPEPCEVIDGRDRLEADRALLEQARERCSEEEWRMLQMRADGASYNDMAQAYGIPPGAVGVRFHRLRKRIRGELDRKGGQR